jgi:tetratricopeptide (TPR) repeat protein
MNNKDIIQITNQTMTKYSSDVIQRGLDLATLMETTKLNFLQSAYLEQGISLYEQEDYEQALACFEQLAVIQPDNYKAWWYKARVLWRLYRSEDALITVEKAIKIKSDFAKAWLTKSAILLDLRRYRDALLSSEKAIEINPKYYQAWNNHGLALKYLGRYSEAEYFFKKAIEINPEYHNGISNLLTLYLNPNIVFPIKHAK